MQFLFLAINGVAVVLATFYNVNTPDLYENNAHHKVGWIATWVMTAQTVMSLLFLYSGRTRKTQTLSSEREAFLPISAANMDQHNLDSPYRDYRWSADSGSPTGRSSTTLNSPRDISPANPFRLSKEIDRDEETGDEDEEDLPMPMPMPASTSAFRSRFRIRAVDAFLSNKVPGMFSHKLHKVAETGYEVVDRTILILGYIAILTGIVTFAGWFVSSPMADNICH